MDEFTQTWMATSSLLTDSIVFFNVFIAVYRVVLDVGFTFQHDQFPNIDRIGSVCCPVIIIHGTHDEIVPFKHGQMLYDLVPDRHKILRPFWAEDMGHNNIEVDATNTFVRYLMEFLQLIRQHQRTGHESIGGPSWTRIPKELTKTFVQTHVTFMMDKELKQNNRFLKRSSHKASVSVKTESTNKYVPGLEYEVVEVSTKSVAQNQPNNYTPDSSSKLRSWRQLQPMSESPTLIMDERRSETGAERA